MLSLDSAICLASISIFLPRKTVSKEKEVGSSTWYRNGYNFIIGVP